MLAVLAVGVAWVGTASAEAATLSVDGSKDCYRAGDTLTLNGTGFTPAGSVSITLDGRELGALTADAVGNITSPLKIGTLRGISQRSVVATDDADSAISASTRFLGSSLLVKVSPRTGDPGRKLR